MRFPRDPGGQTWRLQRDAGGIVGGRLQRGLEASQVTDPSHGIIHHPPKNSGKLYSVSLYAVIAHYNEESHV